MNLSRIFTITAVVIGMLLSACATEREFVSVSNPAQSFELGNLVFLAPVGGGWQYKEVGTPPVKAVLFVRPGDADNQGLAVMVWQFIADEALLTEKDLTESILDPFRDVIDTQEHFKIISKVCDDDKSFGDVGLHCSIEGRHHARGDFWQTGMNRVEVYTVKGHAYAFVHPDDNRQANVIEFLAGSASSVPTVDTKELLEEFARGVNIRR